MDQSQNTAIADKVSSLSVAAHQRIFGGARYEERFRHNARWGMNQIDDFFANSGPVYRTLDKVTRRLAELNIPYAVVGGMALNYHGYKRATTDVDILVKPEGLKVVHESLEGLGYLPPFAGSRHLRDCDQGVKVEFLVTGDYPGDGKPKPFAFPDPSLVYEEAERIRYVNLPTLINLKIASGQFHASRLKDLADVMELIKAVRLPREIVQQLDPYVRDKYIELWEAAQTVFPDAPDYDQSTR